MYNPALYIMALWLILVSEVENTCSELQPWAVSPVTVDVTYGLRQVWEGPWALAAPVGTFHEMELC